MLWNGFIDRENELRQSKPPTPQAPQRAPLDPWTRSPLSRQFAPPKEDKSALICDEFECNADTVFPRIAWDIWILVLLTDMWFEKIELFSPWGKCLLLCKIYSTETVIEKGKEKSQNTFLSMSFDAAFSFFFNWNLVI